jgi:hypothetical protein
MDDVFVLLGTGYTVTAGASDDWKDEYYYSEYQLNLMFYKAGTVAEPDQDIQEEDLDIAQMIFFEENCDINGAHVGMTVAEIQAILGAGEQYDFTAIEGGTVNAIGYVIGDTRVTFYSPTVDGITYSGYARTML